MSDAPEDTTTPEPVFTPEPEQPAETVVGGTITAPANAGYYDQTTGEFK